MSRDLILYTTGTAAGGLFALCLWITAKCYISALRHRIAKLEAQIEAIRDEPHTDIYQGL